MSSSAVFTNNRSQAIRLPADMRLPSFVKRVNVRAQGLARIITPLENTWDSFLLDGPAVPDDFLPERASLAAGELGGVMPVLLRPLRTPASQHSPAPGGSRH